MLGASLEDFVVSGGSWISKIGRSFAVRTTLLAIALAATAAITIPVIARSADDPDAQYAQAGPMGRQWGAEDGQGEPGRHGWRHGMMMRHMMMHGDPQDRCTDRL